MLSEFLQQNSDEIVGRCRAKVAGRFSPAPVPGAVDQGVPLLLQQISDILRREQATAQAVAHGAAQGVARQEALPSGAEIAPSVIGQAAGAHGAQLLRLGYTVDQVVHDYGDVCQSVTELAIERNAPIDTEEFHTLNLCLDFAIAAAVSAFGAVQQSTNDVRAGSLRDQLGVFSAEHRRLIDIATHAFSAIRTGDVGVTGATGKLLIHSLLELRALAERSLPQIQLLSEATTT